MAINIKNREAEALLDEIRAATGKGTTQIVLELARREAERLRRVQEHELQTRLRRLEEISRRAARNVPLDAASPEEIIGYDDWGLPT